MTHLIIYKNIIWFTGDLKKILEKIWNKHFFYLFIVAKANTEIVNLSLCIR